MWKIYVYGMGLKDEYSFGGWQLYKQTENKKEAQDLFEMLEIAHEDKVVLLSPEEDISDCIDDMWGVHSNAPCDNFGMAACSPSCSHYWQCQC